MSEETIKYETIGEPVIANVHRGVTMTVFNGADMIVKVNKKPVGEISGLKFHELFKTKFDAMGNIISDVQIEGHLDVTFFDREPQLRQIIRQEGITELSLEYLSEFGHWCKAEFINPEFTERIHKGTVDMVVFEEKYLFTADDVKYDSGRKEL